MAITRDENKIMGVTPADHVPGPKQGDWTYNHYAALPEDGQRYEIVDGVLFMAPSPGKWHQNAIGEIFSYLRTYIKLTGLGQVYMAPFDVLLAPNTIVQPDVMVVLKANLDKIKDTQVVGAPDLVIEVASPGTSTYDRSKKYAAYARAGVSEYWIVDPIAHTIEVLSLEGSSYDLIGIFHGTETLTSKAVPEIAAVRGEQFFA